MLLASPIDVPSECRQQTNKFLPEARNEHGQNKALRCDPILIKVDGKTPTGLSSTGSAPD